MTMLLAVGCSLMVPLFGGMLWFSPLMFGTPWVRYVFGGKDPSQEGMAAVFIATNIGYLAAFSLQYYILRDVMGAVTVVECLEKTSCLVGIVLGTQISHYAFGQRPVGQYLIEQLFNCVVLLASAVLIGYFG